MRLSPSLLALVVACGPGVDEPDAGSHPIGGECTYDLQCGVGLQCTDGACVAHGDYIWQWGSPVFDGGNCLGVTSEGVYVAGSAFGAVGDEHVRGEDIFVTFTDNGGKQPWTRQWGTVGSEGAYGMVGAPDGSAFVTGRADTDLGVGSYVAGVDLWLSRLSPAGVVLSTRQWGSAGNDNGINLALAGDTLVLVGHTNGALGGEVPLDKLDGFVVRLSLDGVVQWTRLVGTTEDDEALAAAIDDDGNIYVTGSVGAALPGHVHANGQDIYVARYAPDGGLTWTRQWGTSGYDAAFSAATDGDGNLYVAGQTSGELHDNDHLGSTDIFLLKVTADGTRLWTRQWGSDGVDGAAGVALDGDGNILVAGFVRGEVDGIEPLGESDILLSKVTPTGDRMWSRTWGGPEMDGAAGVAVRGPDIYIAGTTLSDLNGLAGGSDAFLLKTSD